MRISTFNNLVVRMGAIAALTGLTTMSLADTFNYEGEIFFCTSTCNSFGALGGATGGSNNTINSVVAGGIDLSLDASGAFSFGPNENTPFAFTISTTAIPLEDPVIGPTADCPPPNQAGQLCNPTTVNPLPLNNSVATVEGAGMVGPDGQLVSGALTFTFTVPPFSNNGAVISFDLSDGSAIGTVFGGAVQFLHVSGTFAPEIDSDGDGVGDSVDNCIMTANTDQRDPDGDGFGAICDTDLNNDCVTNFIDLGLFRLRFFTSDPDADFNGDGVVASVDLGLLRSTFFTAPGPTALPNDCP